MKVTISMTTTDKRFAPTSKYRFWLYNRNNGNMCYYRSMYALKQDLNCLCNLVEGGQTYEVRDGGEIGVYCGEVTAFLKQTGKSTRPVIKRIAPTINNTKR